jgi:hypothetical protein
MLTPADHERFRLETLRQAVLEFKAAIDRDLQLTRLLPVTQAQLRYQIDICNAESARLTDQLKELEIDQEYTVPMQAAVTEAPAEKPKRRRKVAGMEGLT